MFWAWELIEILLFFAKHFIAFYLGDYRSAFNILFYLNNCRAISGELFAWESTEIPD